MMPGTYGTDDKVLWSLSAHNSAQSKVKRHVDPNELYLRGAQLKCQDGQGRRLF
jgi:hypothetical protein